MVEVQDLVKSYGPHLAVDRVSFEVEKGEILGFLGPNGAGKTTTMRILTCFLPATSGTARIDGFDVFEQSREVRRRIGYLPENVPLYLEMSVEGYLVYMAKLKGMDKSNLATKLDDVLESCGLADRRTDLVGRLSRGYRQRVGLAQALMHGPEVLILDEPTASLDPKQIREVRDYIKSLSGEHTIILSTHILPEVELICDRVLVINRGRLVANDTPANLTSYAAAGQVLELEVRGDVNDLRGRLESIAGVAQVTVEGAAAGSDGNCHELHLESTTDVREEVANAIVSGGFGLRSLHVASRSLEDIFVELTTEEPTAPVEVA